MVRRSLFGVRKVNPSRDLDEATLKSIADLTGGRYYRARDPQQLAEIYQTLDELEPIDYDAPSLRPRQSLFHWPLGMALIVSLGALFWPLISNRFGRMQGTA
jgi:Ca-activated chloride channel family protein